MLSMDSVSDPQRKAIAASCLAIALLLQRKSLADFAAMSRAESQAFAKKYAGLEPEDCLAATAYFAQGMELRAQALMAESMPTIGNA